MRRAWTGMPGWPCIPQFGAYAGCNFNSFSRCYTVRARARMANVGHSKKVLHREVEGNAKGGLKPLTMKEKPLITILLLLLSCCTCRGLGDCTIPPAKEKSSLSAPSLAGRGHAMYVAYRTSPGLRQSSSAMCPTNSGFASPRRVNHTRNGSFISRGGFIFRDH